MDESEDTSPAIGIDLGTTNSRVGIWLDEENCFKLFVNDNGNHSTPSYVAFTETERLIGDAARDQVSRNPANTVFDAKRLIGRKYSDLGTDSDKMHIQWPFRVACGKDDKPVIHVEYKGKEKAFSAEEVFSMVLGQMKDLAEVSSGCVVNAASVSVPHCFNSAQRQATRNACSMAGLEKVTLLTEPTCAALAYTFSNNNNTSRRQPVGEKKVIVFDLGGGSLDVSLFSIEDGVIEVKATSGDSQLGGEDFDLRLLHHFIQEIEQKHERDITSHPRVVRRLKKYSERVKLALSSEMETVIQVDSLLEDFDFHSTISRACFEEMNLDLFAKCIKCVEECLQRARVEKADVYEVVLVGGSTQIPKVQQLLAEFFNDEAKLNKSMNAEEAVVCGAAARSAISHGYKAFADYLVVDVAPMSLGLETVGGAMHVVHPRNSSIPTSCEQLFTTCHDDQPGVFIQIFEGENPQACDNMLIATMELSGIAPAPRGVPQILVRFDIDADGILTALAKDKTTGRKVEVYMEDIDIASSRVNDHDERRQRLPIQVYNPSDDSISSSGPHESSNFNEISPHEPSLSVETRSREFHVPVESSITVENSSQPALAYELSNNVKSRSSELSEPLETVEKTSQEFPQSPQVHEAVVKTSQEFPQSPQVHEPVVKTSQEFPQSPQVHEAVEFSEPPQENVESRNVVEGESQEFSAPSPPQVHGLGSYEIRPHELPEPSPALRSSGSQEVRAEELAEAIGIESTAQLSLRGDLSGPPRAYESSIVVEGKPQGVSEAYGSNNTLESGPDKFSALSPPSKELENRPFEHSEPLQVHGLSSFESKQHELPAPSPDKFLALSPASKELENRPLGHSEPLQVHGLNSYESKQHELPVPSPASGALEIRSDEFTGPPAASGFSNTAEIKSQEFPANGSSNTAVIKSQEFPANGSGNAVESSSHVSVVHKIIETVQLIASMEDFQTHKKECSTLIRRANLLLPLFVEFRDSELPSSEAVFTCFNSFEAALDSAKALLLLCNEGSKLYLILKLRKVAEHFLLVNTALVQALDELPDSLEISEEVREQVDLVHSQLKRSKGLEDALDAQLNAELTSVLDETNGRSPDQLTRLAESFKLGTAEALRKEFQALRGMMTEKELNRREFDQIYGLVNDLKDLYPVEEDQQKSEPPQAHGSSEVVESSSQEFSAPPQAPPPVYTSEDKPPTEPAQVYRAVESSPPPQASYKSSHSFEDRSHSEAPPQVYPPQASYKSSQSFEDRSHSEAPPQVFPPQASYKSSQSFEDRSHSEAPPQVFPPQASYKSSHSFEDRSHSEAPPQVFPPQASYKSSHSSEDRSQSEAPPQVYPPQASYKSSQSFEDRSHSEAPPQVFPPQASYKSSQSFEDRSHSEAPPQVFPPQASYKSSHSFEDRSHPEAPPQVHGSFSVQEVSAPPPVYTSEEKPPTEPAQVYRAVESSPLPQASYKSSHSFEDRSHSEAPPIYRQSKTFGSRPHESLEPFITPRSESRSQEFSGISHERVPTDRSSSSSGLSPVYKAGNGVESRPQGHPEPLLQAYRTNNISDEASPSQRSSNISSELSPVYKSSNASQVSSEHTYKSSSTCSEMSSEEFSGSGPLRALGELDKVPELHRSATCATEPILNAPRPENGRSASCPQIRMSDSIIEDVVKKYNWDDVLYMTDNLTSRQLGKGGFGAVYLGTLENGKEVAVKILDASSQQGISEFLNEVNLLKRVNHMNLIRLLGYCQDERQVLIYEFAEEGSIWDHLQAGGTSLDWKRRLDIALQSAKGLDYLHTGCSPRIIHRDIKSQNILLTKSFVAKVADFGLSKLGADQDNLNKTHVTTMVKGTLGYLDPEYLKTGQLTDKSDVYSFGVILLEIITGRKPIQNSDKKCFIGDWVDEHYYNGASNRALKTVVDPSLGAHYNPKSLKRVIDVAKLCTQPYGANRPEMTDVVRALKKAQAAELGEKKPSKWSLPFRS